MGNKYKAMFSQVRSVDSALAAEDKLALLLARQAGKKEVFMKKKYAIILTAALICALSVVGTLARESIAEFFSFYEPHTQQAGPTTAGWAPPAYTIHGVEPRVERYLPDTKELLVTITNTSDRELEWSGNYSTYYQLLYWDGAKWDFAPLKEGWAPHPQPYNSGALPPGEAVTVRYALEDYPPLQEGTRYRIEVWIKDPSVLENQGFIDSYQVNAEFELPL